MSDLQATSVKRFQPLMFAGRLLSFLLFGMLICAGWIGLSYCKNNLFFTERNLITPAPNQLSSTTTATRKADNQTTTSGKATEATAPLIYIQPTDKQRFHTAKHLSANRERIAISKEAAIERGLKPCPICLTQ